MMKLHEFDDPVSCGTPTNIDNMPTLNKSKSVGIEINKSRVNHPSHYSWLKEKCGIEPIDIMRHLDYDSGAALKYILRAGRKQESGMTEKEKAVEDLQKAIYYINDRINFLMTEE